MHAHLRDATAVVPVLFCESGHLHARPPSVKVHVTRASASLRGEEVVEALISGHLGIRVLLDLFEQALSSAA